MELLLILLTIISSIYGLVYLMSRGDRKETKAIDRFLDDRIDDIKNRIGLVIETINHMEERLSKVELKLIEKRLKKLPKKTVKRKARK